MRPALVAIDGDEPKSHAQIRDSVAAALGVLDQIVTATDPYETDFGRAHADQQLPQRIRR